jgi:hypothetical protein
MSQVVSTFISVYCSNYLDRNEIERRGIRYLINPYNCSACGK